MPDLVKLLLYITYIIIHLYTGLESESYLSQTDEPLEPLLEFVDEFASDDEFEPSASAPEESAALRSDDAEDVSVP